ncbi:hypothetical protein M378DRAFT_12843 [Amanita muscaria Koide BX008]|uniref:Uncharacterized protein n=1 Tax=Amanita muscaria (strain Koide BX008) TaxID=946122 RepID=A0A0C2WZR5_AMAMK|nr:hypothetical protein M378DRAFT_12843 [Amanita muscaria Koide BX008]
MTQATQSPSKKSGVHVDYNAAVSSGQLIQIKGRNSTTPSSELQGQPASGQESPFLSGPDEGAMDFTSIAC